MKNIILLIILFFIMGCAKPNQINIPEPFEKPQAQDYELKIININGIDFFALTEYDAEILSRNWISYKNWAESNYKLLIQIKKNLNDF